MRRRAAGQEHEDQAHLGGDDDANSGDEGDAGNDEDDTTPLVAFFRRIDWKEVFVLAVFWGAVGYWTFLAPRSRRTPSATASASASEREWLVAFKGWYLAVYDHASTIGGGLFAALGLWNAAAILSAGQRAKPPGTRRRGVAKPPQAARKTAQ